VGTEQTGRPASNAGRPARSTRLPRRSSRLGRWRAGTLVALELDHVLIAVANLAAAAREIDARYGLASIEGGRHAGWGTVNRIVPLGETYVELISVADQAEAGQSSFGSWVAAALSERPQPLGWAVRTHELDEIARRLDLEVTAGSRPSRGGGVLRWRLAGLEQAAADPVLPFFLEWGPGTPFPGRIAATHRASDLRITELQLRGDADRLAAWLGGHNLPLTLRPGTPAVTGVVLTGAEGEIVLDADRL
jgi:hypothetical protein